MVKGLCETVQLQLLKDVLLRDLDERDRVCPGTTPLPELSIGWSFLKHPSNGLESWRTWLLDHLPAETPLRERFVAGADNSQTSARALWRDDAVCEYMRGVRRFQESLFALVHLSGGGPGRGTERQRG